MRLNDITHRVIAGAIEVHRTVGPGLLESVYEECLVHELRSGGLEVERQIKLPLLYKGLTLPAAFRIDLMVASHIVVEVKAVDRIDPVHAMQVITYLRLTQRRVGLLINFNVPRLVDGIRRLVNNFDEDAANAKRARKPPVASAPSAPLR